MSKHTPGPWISKGGQIYAEDDSRGQTLALIPYYDREAVQDANARLIAAAPALLEALRLCVGIIEDQMHGVEEPETETPTFYAASERARAALALAEGEK